MLSFVAVLTVILAVVEASCMHGTSLLPRQLSVNGTVVTSKFGYHSHLGPLLWQSIGKDNLACEKGQRQSPINIDKSIPRALNNPIINVGSAESVEFENLGTTVEVIANGTALFANKNYTLKQFHLHSPSEHHINGEYFPLEMHLVHEAADKNLLVIAVLFQLSTTNHTVLLSKLAHTVSRISKPGATTQCGPLDLSPIARFLETRPLRQYSGSLTTPPCKEGVTFLVTERPLAVDVSSFNALKKVLRFNSRFTQGQLGEVNLIEQAVESFKA